MPVRLAQCEKGTAEFLHFYGYECGKRCKTDLIQCKSCFQNVTNQTEWLVFMCVRLAQYKKGTTEFLHFYGYIDVGYAYGGWSL